MQALSDRIVDDLAETGLSITDNFLSPDEIAMLANEARELRRQGEFRLAEVGNGALQEKHTEIRSDRIHWLDPQQLSPLQAKHFARIEELRLAINRHLFLGAFEFEGFMAIYPPGSFYKKHWDRFAGMPHRVVTVILYLNEAWQETDGGMLRVYLNGDEDESSYQDIAPLAGRLVVFLSGRFPHEVMPAHRDRISLTGWLRIRPTADEGSNLFLSAS